MSLVAYGSSDESDSEETSTSAAPQSKGLFSMLPAPKKPRSTGGSGGPRKEIKAFRSPGNSTSNDDLTVDPKSSKGGLFSSLPKPRKRTEPVKITVPQIQRRDSDSDDDDEPAKKKVQPQGSGLFSLLPQPRNMTVKAMSRSLVPHTLTKRQGPKPGKPTQGLLGSSSSPSAIKAAAKSAALQLARQIATDDQDKEEDMTPQNYFSLCESSQPLPAVVPSLDPEPGAPAEPLALAPAEPLALAPAEPLALAPAEPLALAPADEPGQSDAPLDFGGNHEGAGPWGGQYPPYQQAMEGPEALPQGYYNEPFFQDPETGSAEAEEPGSSAMFEDEAFMRLQGKRNRGKEEVKFLEIKGDDQLSGNQQWMTKSMTEEKQTRQSFSKKNKEQPTGQQRRKHQITYLIHQAKERELELKNSWADNKLTRRQTQAKYGF
ncbi:proline-rich protein PRCC [Cyclopterus lumpus]|uniref:Proline rich mitotic checkpoint control factor n=1 Tax=Cyclopterus lumpus TaxID=8103 RepID=A0A8C2WM24_CYCLU|nr:proline-rich protein PRCC [Cyclopterus lumpus]